MTIHRPEPHIADSVSARGPEEVESLQRDMLPTLIAGLVVAVVSAYALRAFQRAYPGLIGRKIQAAVGIATIALAAGLLFRGSLGSALAVGSLGIWLLQDANGRQGGGGVSGHWPKDAVTSRVVTDHLDAEVEVQTGRLRGRVTRGFFKGRAIERLRPVELVHLWQDCRFTDPRSAELVAAWLERVHPTWQADLARAEAEAPRGPDGKMTRTEALDILGLKEGATNDEIRRAHRDLMLRLHPDRGGSNYLAAKINEAKDVALGT